jgi:carboxyl-terminal processing protease
VKKYPLRGAHRIICSVVIVLLIVGQPAYASEAVRNDSPYFNEMMDFIKDHYYGEVSDEMLFEGAVKGMFLYLDSYTTFMTPEEKDAFYGSISGNFGGIGVTLQLSGDYIVVTQVFRGSPAEKAGMLQGDIIVEAEGTNLAGASLDDATAIIRGEPGTTVRLGVLRGGSTVYIDVVREIVKVNPVTYENRNGIGYIKIETFNSNTSEYITEALEYFDKRGINRLVLDLRNNPGGETLQAVMLAAEFVPEGLITLLDYKSQMYRDVEYHSNLKEPKYKLAVLVNGGSASASEIVAGAIQDTGAGKLIGTRTYGKAKFQNAVPVLTPEAYDKYREQYGIDTVNVYELRSYGIYPDQEEIYGYAQMTLGVYYTPSGKLIDGIGIAPDIPVDDPGTANGVHILGVQRLSKSEDLEPGSKGTDIINAKMILKILGYEINELDINFDEKLESAIKEYQSSKRMKPSVVLDVKTQIFLNADLLELVLKYDGQYAAAVEYLKN